VAEEISPTYAVVVDLAGVGVSLVNKKMVEVIYLLMDSIKFEYTNSLIAQSVNLSCGNLQIDNQLHEALYPVILQPTPISKEASAVGALPTVQASIIWLKDQGWIIPHRPYS
jgi:vacuolar protein sorting-associated protein 13A/C